MQMNKADIVGARHASCSFSGSELAAMLAVRFPADPVDLPALVDAWIADQSLSAATLRQCCYLIAAAAQVPEAARRDAMNERDPRRALAGLRQHV